MNGNKGKKISNKKLKRVVIIELIALARFVFIKGNTGV